MIFWFSSDSCGCGIVYLTFLGFWIDVGGWFAAVGGCMLGSSGFFCLMWVGTMQFCSYRLYTCPVCGFRGPGWANFVCFVGWFSWVWVVYCGLAAC